MINLADIVEAYLLHHATEVEKCQIHKRQEVLTFLASPPNPVIPWHLRIDVDEELSLVVLYGVPEYSVPRFACGSLLAELNKRNHGHIDGNWEADMDLWCFRFRMSRTFFLEEGELFGPEQLDYLTTFLSEEVENVTPVILTNVIKRIEIIKSALVDDEPDESSTDIDSPIVSSKCVH